MPARTPHKGLRAAQRLGCGWARIPTLPHRATLFRQGCGAGIALQFRHCNSGPWARHHLSVNAQEDQSQVHDATARAGEGGVGRGRGARSHAEAHIPPHGDDTCAQTLAPGGWFCMIVIRSSVGRERDVLDWHTLRQVSCEIWRSGQNLWITHVVHLTLHYSARE